MLEKYESGTSNDAYKIVADDQSWFCAHEPETKQQSIMWTCEDKPNPTKVVCGKSTSKQMVVCFFDKTGHVATVPLSSLAPSILSGTPQFLWRNLKNEQEKTNHCSQWQCEFSQIGLNQRIFDRPKR